MLVMGVCMAKGMRKSKGDNVANVEDLRAEDARAASQRD
jgi:hypothetical protein